MRWQGEEECRAAEYSEDQDLRLILWPGMSPSSTTPASPVSAVLFFPRKCDGHVCRFVPSFGLNNLNQHSPLPLPSPPLSWLRDPSDDMSILAPQLTWSILSSADHQTVNICSQHWVLTRTPSQVFVFPLLFLHRRWKQRADDNVWFQWLMLAKCVLDGWLSVIIQYLHWAGVGG